MCVSPIKSYINHRLHLFNCGTCEECQQEKADSRSLRIKFETSFLPADYVTVFVTLTYSDDYVPYVPIEELNEPYFNIYRGFSNNCKILTSNIYNNECDNNLFSLPILYDSFLPVCYFKDIQDFQKRLRISQLRKYGRLLFRSYYQCSEYGTRRFRPHFHLLFTCKKSDVPLLRSSIMSSWSYCDYDVLSRWFEIAVNPSNYVASYVNQFSNLPPFLRQKCFIPKYSFSQNFGFSPKFFSLSSILDNVRKGVFVVSLPCCVNGQAVTYNVNIPSYVKNRYFPKCFGYSKLSSQELFELYLNPLFNSRYFVVTRSNLGSIFTKKSFFRNSIHFNCYTINRCYEKYYAPIGINRFDFALSILDFYRRFHSNLIHQSCIHNDYDLIHGDLNVNNTFRLERNKKLFEKYTKNFKHKYNNSFIYSHY